MNRNIFLAAALAVAGIAAHAESPDPAGQFAAPVTASAYRAAPAGKSVAQVRAETLQAIRHGDMLMPGELGITQRQAFPQLYAARQAADQGVQTARFAGLHR